MDRKRWERAGMVVGAAVVLTLGLINNDLFGLLDDTPPADCLTVGGRELCGAAAINYCRNAGTPVRGGLRYISDTSTRIKCHLLAPEDAPRRPTRADFDSAQACWFELGMRACARLGFKPRAP